MKQLIILLAALLALGACGQEEEAQAPVEDEAKVEAEAPEAVADEAEAAVDEALVVVEESAAVEEESADDDVVVEVGGVTLLVDPMSFQYLVGSEVDYTEGLEGSRFVVNNPNAATTCGCGASFSI